MMLRKEKKIEQTEIAKWIGVTTETYGAKEKGKTQFKADEMFIIAEHFGLPVDKIFLKSNVSLADFLLSNSEKQIKKESKYYVDC